MKWERKDVINICKIVAFGVILYWALQNFMILTAWIKTLLGILSPFIAGIAIAFIINIPMSLFERKVFKIRRKKDGKKVKDNSKTDNKTENTELSKLAKMKRFVSILLSLIIIILIIVGIIFLVIPEILDVIKEAIAYLPHLVEDIGQYIKQIIIDYPEVEGTLTSLQSNLETLNADVIKDLTAIGTNLVTSSFGMISYTFNALLNAIIAIIFAIYILMGKESIKKQAKKMTYAFLSERKANQLCKFARLSKESFNNFLTGQFTECIILGSLCTLGMWILQIPYSVTVGVLVAITAFIPIVGALIGAAIGVILLIPISITKVAIFIVFFIILQQIENNLIYPRVVGNSVGVPGYLVLISVTVGGFIGGAIGMAISLPVTAVLFTLVKESTTKRLKRKGKEDML